MEPEKLCDAPERGELSAIRREKLLATMALSPTNRLDGEAPELRLLTSARLPGMVSPGTVITENGAEQSSAGAREGHGRARDGLQRRGQRDHVLFHP